MTNSFKAVVLPHLDAAYNLARWLVRDRVAAEDVVQDAMLRALTYYSGYRGGNPRAWLLQIVRNAAYGANRVDRGRHLVPLDDCGVGDRVAIGDDDPERALIKAREKRDLAALIGALPIELREVLVLREFEEMSYKDIAAVTQIPIGTVMSRLFRARRMLVGTAGEGGKS